jgi:hypothetical protein
MLYLKGMLEVVGVVKWNCDMYARAVGVLMRTEPASFDDIVN